MRVDPATVVRFLRTAYEPEDWVAIFLKSYPSGRVAQRVRSVAAAQRETFQAWLRAENAAGADVYVSLNAIAPHQRSRRGDAILAIRHVFLDADHLASEVLDMIARRSDLPQPSYTLNSSPQKAHIFWRAAGFASPPQLHLVHHGPAAGAALGGRISDGRNLIAGARDHGEQAKHWMGVDLGTRATQPSQPQARGK